MIKWLLYTYPLVNVYYDSIIICYFDRRGIGVEWEGNGSGSL